MPLTAARPTTRITTRHVVATPQHGSALNNVSVWLEPIRDREECILGILLCALSTVLEAATQKHPHLTAEELAEFREIFNLVDLDKGGTISKEELRQLMTTLGLKPTQEELNRWWRDRHGRQRRDRL